MFPENRIKRIYRSLDENIKLAFVSTIILGLICHIYMLTNKWVNLDDIVQLVDNMDRTTSGRWFLAVPSAISSDFSIPWLNGFLTIIYTAIISSTIVHMFKVKSKINTILISGILVTFPTLTALMPFMNTQDSYQFGAMLATFASLLLVKYKYGFVGSIILLTLSLGIYQSYLGFSAGLVVIYMMIELFNNKKDIREVLDIFIKTALTYSSAILLYIIISRGIFGHLLVDYKGLDNMGSIPLDKLHLITFDTYKYMYMFLAGKEFNYHFVFMPYLFGIAVILTLYLIYYIIKKSKIEKKNILYIIFLLLIFPIVVNIIYIMAWEGGVMLRMAYGYTILFIFPLLLMDYIMKRYDREYIKKDSIEITESNIEIDENNIRTNENNNNKPNRYKKGLIYYSMLFLTLTSVLSVYNNIYVANKVYFKVGVTNQNSENYGNRIISRLEMVDGYTENTKIVFLGKPDSRTWFTKEYDPRDVEPFIIANHLTRLYSFKYYPVRFLGFNNPIKDYDEFEPEIKHLKPYFENLKVYPAEESIQMIDGVIYVKFKDID